MPAVFNPTFKALFVASWLLCVGCQPEESVTSYSVARTTLPHPPLDVATLKRQMDHMLVAIVPQQDKVWFLKMVGKAPAIGRQRDAFLTLVSTVKLADSPSTTPSWELPPLWKEKGATGMRRATLVVPDEDGDLELAVSSLPLTEKLPEFLVPNVNRWLRQLQQPPLPRATVESLAQRFRIRDGDVVATIFELSGSMATQSPGANPHAGLVAGNAGDGQGVDESPATGSAGNGSTDSASIASSDGGSTNAGPTRTDATGAGQTKASSPVTGNTTPAATRAPLTYQTPDQWQPGKLSMMRKAAFLLPSGKPSDEVTVMSFPAAPGTQMDDVAANVQRWAGQVGMAPPNGDQLEELTQPIEIAGIEGSYVELMSPADSQRKVALFAAMIKRDGQVWFFKMVGSSDVVIAQRTAFRDFLRSVRFR